MGLDFSCDECALPERGKEREERAEGTVMSVGGGLVGLGVAVGGEGVRWWLWWGWLWVVGWVYWSSQ